ncbi:surface protease GP63 [Trypanosoma theileri]|uniref:Leishmanolysin-like peptidase n=1 Tax=Trypanosoma theileri TaxID=67003 RepID=A0A1X0NK66_9TRYP|nr:surface protease GP63 [Trypanosoma theileri]ORC85125.1 surface protease GP63 [Trypanosoma theileri]
MMRHPLLQVVLLLFICGTVAGPAYACNYDEIKKKNSPPVVVVRELPKKGEGAWQTYTVATSEGENDKWEPLRINVSYENLKEDKYCVKEKQELKHILTGQIVQCAIYEVIDEIKKNTITNKILPEAIKLHTDRLLVQRIKTPWKVPDMKEHTVCSHFTSPGDRASHGVQDADFLLYVAAGPRDDFASATWAVTCAIDDQTKRPVVGAMNIDPSKIHFTRENVRFIAHQLAHALGFDYENMMKEVLKNGEKKTQTVVKSAKVLEEAREHYGCNDLQEVELERTAVGEPTSHWNRRNTKDELMSMVSTDGSIEGIGYYTALTIASFEDLGFYRGNFKMAEPMSWGYKANCKFLEATCKEKDKPVADGNSCSPYPAGSCTSDRLGVAKCVEPKNGNPSCPILKLNTEVYCDITFGLPKNWPGLHGEYSWCLDSDALTFNDDKGKSVTINGMCAAVECSDDGVVKVQLKKDGEWYNCPKEGVESIPLNGTEYSTYVGKNIKCPKYDEVCTVRLNGSSRLRLQVEEQKQSTPTNEENAVNGTTDTTPSDLPSPTAVSDTQGLPTNTEDSDQRTTTTPTTAEPNNAHTTGSSTTDSTTPTATVNNNGKTTGSSTTDSTTPQVSVDQKNNTMNIEIVSWPGKDQSQATKVYPPLVLLVLFVLTLLISF